MPHIRAIAYETAIPVLTAHPLLTVYLGGVVLGLAALAWLQVKHPDKVRQGVEDGAAVGGYPRPFAVFALVMMLSVAWPVGLLLLAVIIKKGMHR